MQIRKYFLKFGGFITKYIVTVIYFAVYCLILGLAEKMAMNIIGQTIGWYIASAAAGWWLFNGFGKQLIRIYRAIDNDE